MISLLSCLMFLYLDQIFSHVTLSFLFSDRTPANSGGQPCKKHELYVSFSDLGWKVSALTIWE